MITKYICRKCDKIVLDAGSFSNCFCEKCRNEMELVTDSVSITVISVRDQVARDEVEKIIFRKFLDLRMPVGVLQVLKELPSQVLSDISRTEGMNLARQLHKAGAALSVILEETGEDIFKQSLDENLQGDKKSVESVKKYKVLVVEDNRSQLHFVAKVIESRGDVEIEMAENGVEAMIKISKVSFDLMITDILMPHMDGLELIRAVRTKEHLKDIPIIVLTSVATPKEVKQIIDFNVSAYVLKPISREVLLSRVAKVLRAVSLG